EAALVGENLLQRRARHVLEDGVEPAVLGLARVEQTDDVRVREPGAEPHLAPEALALVRDLGRCVVAPEAQDLDRDRLPGGALPCLVDAPEAPRAELGENLVRVPEDRARGEDALPCRARRHAGRLTTTAASLAARPSETCVRTGRAWARWASRPRPVPRRTVAGTHGLRSRIIYCPVHGASWRSSL